ncbi:TetR/AcrR family transcriptional regulator [Leucobacter viscericola]|uniref:TetR/AcrR family transcriptional regulator n=1 Tax=Leucobacter viscericola TaxID=2714935 RepID=A0A6G7XDW1_9MICO|nr:TetR/AcrR family transcriptional regulator [Leucobacter viscericola]QIK62800.1 TetR/AcrR family transcriptional regulator [Leucobacter viscericola]
MNSSSAASREDGRRARGDLTRGAVLAEAIQVASEQGLADMSIGQLASAAGLSKSGVATLFGSKEALQLAVIDHAREVFVSAVITPCRDVPSGGERLRAVALSWLRYSQNRVFRGGCFFLAAATEFDSQPGPVRDRIAECLREWDDYLVSCAKAAVSSGQLRRDADPQQLGFELFALFAAVNTRALLYGDEAVYAQAEESLRRILAG